MFAHIIKRKTMLKIKKNIFRKKVNKLIAHSSKKEG